MRPLRAAVRLAALAAFTAAVCALNFVLLPVAWFAAARSIGIRVACLNVWGRGAAWILGIRVAVEGTPPSPPFFLVTNHLGYADVIVLASQVPACFVGKSELARWPGLGPLITSMGTIFVERERAGALHRVVERMVRVATSGHGVTFFPEGTSSAGERVLRFRSSLFEAAARTGYPVCCASLWYGTPGGEAPAALSVCWWGDMTFGDHLWRLLQLPRIDAAVSFDSRRLVGADRKELAGEASATVRRVFRPVAGEERE